MPLLRIRSDETRFLLSDILPYETPACFSNRQLVRFLRIVKKSGAKFRFVDGDKKVVKIEGSIDEIHSHILCMLFGLSVDSKDSTLVGSFSSTRPYQFQVVARNNKMRVLSIVHPSCQLIAMLFTKQYKDLVLYYCGRSAFSIRHPVSVAKMKFVKDKAHSLPGIIDLDRASKIEMEELELETLKSFYRYKDFLNIYRFYESRQNHRLEEKYRCLARFDISNCFDSVYTHSIPWAVYGKDFVKSNLKSGQRSFADDFDKLLQSMNYNETHGIVIGPEFSRVAAEIILQRVDLAVEKNLGENKLVFKKDYEILRYVDDYFVFYNRDEDYEVIHSALVSALYEYKFSLNESKTTIVSLPWISHLSVVKAEISKLIDDVFSSKEDNGIGWNFSVDDIITRIKMAVQCNTVAYADVIPYLLSLIERKIISLIRSFGKVFDHGKMKASDPGFLAVTFEKTLSLVFYMLLPSVPVNAYIIASRIIAMMAETIKKVREKNFEFKIPQHRFYQLAIREMSRLIDRLENEGEHVKALHVINLAECVEDGLYLSLALLEKVLKKGECDYLTLSVLLHYSRDLNRFGSLKTEITTNALGYINSPSIGSCKRTDICLLAFDLASCPYISRVDRENILSALIRKIEKGNSHLEKSKHRIVSFLEKNPVSFTNWNTTGILEALEYKQGFYVY